MRHIWKKKKNCVDHEKLKNMDNIVFLFLFDSEQKIVLGFSELKFLGICPIYHSLFCIIP